MAKISSLGLKVSQWSGLDIADYPCPYLPPRAQSIVFVFPFSKFHAKGTEKTETLRKHLDNEELKTWKNCCVQKWLFWAFIKKLVSDLLAIPCLTCQANKHFAKKISQLFYYWLTNESSICLNINSVNTSNDFISTIDKFLLQNVWDSFDCHFGQGWDNWFSLTNCSETGDELDLNKNYFLLLDYFRFHEKVKLTLLAMPMRPVTIRISLNKNSLHQQIHKKVVKEGKVDSITYYDKEQQMKASYTVV